MFKVYYYRTNVNVFDERQFHNIDELNAWLKDIGYVGGKIPNLSYRYY